MENKSIHILIVDDDDRIRSLLKDYLTENKYIVSTIFYKTLYKTYN